MRVGYLISQYPKVSHTFIQREVAGLRELGFDITTISIRGTSPGDLLTEVDREEAARTRVVIPSRWSVGALGRIAGAMLMAAGHPWRLVRAARTAWSLRRPGLRGAVWAWFYLVEAAIVHRWCAREGIRHLHAHFANVGCDVAMIATVLNEGQGSATFSFTMHGPTEFAEQSLHRLREKAAAAAAVVCISDFARSQMMPLLPAEDWGKLHVVHCGVDPEAFAAERDDIAMRRPVEELNLLCVARLTEVKGHAILLRAVALLAGRGRAVRLTLAGDGPMRGALEKLAAALGVRERVIFLGNVGQDVMHRHYAAADVFVLPSFAEGVPVVLMEAMAAGCPVVATRINGVPELIEDGVSGVLVTAGRADLLAEGIERAVASPAATARRVAFARETVRRAFNIHRTSAEMAALYGRLVGGLKAVPSEARREPERLPARAGVLAEEAGPVVGGGRVC